MAKVCETVLVNDMAALRGLRDASMADLIELRLDGVRDLDVRGAVAGRRKQVILTCRASWEGGRFEGSEEERLRILAGAIGTDAEYVDIEWKADRRALPAIEAQRLVLSHHDFSGVPQDLPARVASMRSACASGVVKLAAATKALSDLLALRDVAAADPGRHVVIGMGAAGTLSRVLPVSLGSQWTYGGQAAPGQTTVGDLIETYRIRNQSSSTRVFGLTGSPLGHSASPAMHNAAFAAEGIDAVYVPLETDQPRDLLEVARAFGVEGVSVTAPLKRAWAAVGVEVDERARAIGAANTLRREERGWTATNFDVDGFLAPLRAAGIELRGLRSVVLGTGGAARAAAWALTREGAAVTISGRRRPAAETLAVDLGAQVTSWPPPRGWQLLVNATPVGTAPDSNVSPIPRESIEGAVVYDLVYHPRRTQLLEWAAAAGAKTIEGLGMLVEQAALQFEHWIGRPAPREVMRKAAEEFLRAK